MYTGTYARRSILQATGGVLLAGLATQSTTAQAVTGPSVYLSRSESIYAVDADTGDEQWRFTGDATFYSSPTVVDGTVYVGNSDQTLYAIDAATGEEVWAYTDPTHEIRSSPTVVDDTVYVGGSPFGDGTVHAVDAATGEQRWRFTAPQNRAPATPTVADGSVYISGGTGTVYSVDAETGQQTWSYTFADAEIDSRPTVADGTVFVGTDGFVLRAIDADSGDEQWSVDNYSGIISAPTVVDGTVYAGAGPYNDAGPLFAVSAATGDVEWEYPTPGGIEGGPTVADGTVYVGTQAGTLHAVEAATGDEQWVFTRSDARFGGSVPTVLDGAVYVNAEAGNAYAVDAATGEQLWSFTSGTGSQSSPTVVTDPETGDSSGSRVRLGTLGHTDYWASRADSDVALRLNNVGSSAWEGTTIVGDAISFDADAENPTITLQSGTRYFIENGGWPTHPLEFRDGSGGVLLSQDATGQLEADSAIAWTDTGDTLAFTLTEELGQQLSTYACTVHASMQGSITRSSAGGGGGGGEAPSDPQERALQIAGKDSAEEVTQNDVTAAITRFNRGEPANDVAVEQDDVTTLITLFERN
jgi:outer membrane protein assembly factor BamB